MKRDIKWLVYLGVEQELFELQPCLDLKQSLGEEVDIVAFAEALLEQKACTDFDGLQTLVEQAYGLAQADTPPDDPFQRKIAVVEETKEEEPEQAIIPEGMPDLSTANLPTDETAAADFMRKLLQACHEMGASDLHLSAGARPFARHTRNLSYLSDENLTDEASELLNLSLLSDDLKKRFTDRQDLDFALPLGKGERYRVNLMCHKEGIAGTYRLIPNKVPTLSEVGFDDLERIKKLLSYNNGLILVTGPVGSGKTVTLAAMMDEINRTRNDHVIAVEEPIEIVQDSKECHLTQREVGRHTKSFSSALKGALRQDPDIIVIGEMRDLETIEMAISASETGHLVIGTLHTADAANTLNRVLDVFPASQQTQIRIMLSHALRGIICQNLIPAVDGGMALAYELLICNTAVRALIHENKPEGLVNVMETGASEGMRVMDKSILSLWEKDIISDKVALSSLKSDMKRHQLRELIKLQRPTYAHE
ncbi:type IV pili twitching motility protein PilT [Coraliomargarita sinensis]|uniref:Type IV pili twitching motility protein PilT n=1 Tax=Coraliomargarita sinensis TaxID=2174842 RepID=A0A317ZI48_9BACT|nr:PilT/PilU family type 4a pilus ATPase [Coraliomargarita sinensis]PXA04652.1 type IV pili twitching motility protein PilT [Coraliomargarita sinensis]